MAGPGPNPIAAEAARKALTPDQRAAAAHDASVERARLDQAELRELERSELYGETPPARQPSRLRSILDRLFRR